MKKTTLIFAALLTLSACKKDLTSLNKDPKNPPVVPSYALFTEAERLLANTMTTPSVNSNIFRLIEQQWTETQYLNETQYQLTYRKQPDGLWASFYSSVLINFEKSKQAMSIDVKDAATLKNETAMADILQVYTYYYLVTTFGNIPYSEALDINKPFPKYDDAKTVYSQLLTRLDADIAALDPGAGTIGSADIIYGGDIAKWQKFANSFKLKMGITIADSDPATAQATVQSAVSAGVFTSNDDNALFQYVATPPNTNPVWVNLVQSGRHDFIATSEFMNMLNPGKVNQDPRLPYYFAPSLAHDQYVGAPNGSGNGSLAFAQYSLPGGPLLTPGAEGSLTNPDFPGDLLDYSETEFNLAEAVARGFAGVSGTVESHYNAAVTASVEYWTGDAAAAATYLTFANVKYATALGATPLQKIAGQEYIALYNRGWDAWTVNRRLDYPKLVPPPNAFSDFPVRFTYPISEQNVNQPNYEKAAAAIGGDKVTTRLFFDTK
ncbi:SusD/RagB family nutrient-binding outer membrane lipoprotein [Mucilaginibacter sp. L3T2-6]|uniref:SusD/RagB family nutrient-binding outer membrane lipoprotein n=1 Tax=Mucilaginibacter sp. L3T2-6 TaxID=3062491 RepID=UPI002676EF2A|nr:SusD/RagB family nutrient-binding outer membrane lipoprotein [Mucilaginibacter sp. L3T2-6]MDO3644333.1 SusD/RagB family nutrient-binding outer membrane lipoprotein [Mucilaginibacter sp. L3T2-6]MDV6216784.1 SusD/RagB family nutrient-binding outer membrane lipoprotein [Mucilaginibacter sp. L3T2-6]